MALRFSPARGAGTISIASYIRGATGATGATGSTGATGPGYTATSTTSNTVASSGSKVFTTQSGLAYTAGARVRAADASAPSTNYMEGVVTAYSGATLTFTADRSAGSGTLTNWNINVVGDIGTTGSTGSTGATGPGYTATSTTSNTVASSGSKVFTTQSGLAYTAGARVRAADTSLPSTNYMEGVVTAYSATTLTFTADLSAGSGTLTAWTINLAGDRGTTGATGAAGSGVTGGANHQIALYSAAATISGGMTVGTDGQIPVGQSAADPIFKTISGLFTMAATGVTTGSGNAGILQAPGTWKVVYTDGSSVLTALALGASGTLLAGGGTSAAPTFSSLATLHIVADNATSALTAGYTSASVSAGTKSSGTYTFDPTAGAVQHATNGGAHTFAPSATHGSWMLDYVNNASAGALTTSGWTKVDGDAFDTTNTHSFRCFLSVGNQGSYLSVKRMV